MTDILIQGGHTPAGQQDIRIIGNRITEVARQLPVDEKTQVIDASEYIVWPGLVNTHHHIAQSIMKGMPAGIDSDLDQWLPAVPFAAWPHITPDTLYVAARIGFSELLRSGCTTCADHHYLYDEDTTHELEAVLFQAAEEVGIRLVLARGGATASATHAGLASAPRRTEKLETCLTRMQDTFSKHHNMADDAMTKLAVAPTSLVHSSTPDDLRVLADFARSNALRMHSHLLEVARDEVVAQSKYGMSAINFAESVNWLGPDVWFAHLVATSSEDIARLGETRTGIAHCPVSNARLGSGISNVPEMQRAGVKVTIGVDGSASAESGSMINELMQTWLVHRAVQGSHATNVDTVLNWGSEAGASLLGIAGGKLKAGQVADLTMFRKDEPRFLGVWKSYQGPLICGEPVTTHRVMVNGRWVVEDNRVIGLDYGLLKSDATRELTRLKALI
ncbi:MAG: 8-oxoguanine deaminase [Candidatus Azotimanducaceae bacterium]